MISLFERALALDPLSVSAQSWLANVLTSRLLDEMADNAAADMARAEQLAEQALALSPHSLLGHYAKAQVLRAQGRYKEAIPEYETVLAINRNWVAATAQLGQCKLFTGSIEETIPLVERAIRLSPRDGQIANWYWRIGVVHLLQSRLDEAIFWFEKARSANSGHPVSHIFLASAHSLKGEIERGAAELAEARRLSRDDRYLSVARVRADRNWGVPKIRALFEATYFTGLRKAGVPEE
jgi:tetratricopeptide (TPR) repeat protein